MKGVIVQVGEPKSIVLFNNGKIRAIPTPVDCRVGMVVSVKLNNRIKIIAVTLAAVFLLGLGVFIGTTLNADKSAVAQAIPAVPPAPPRTMMPGPRMMGRRDTRIQTVTVEQLKNLPDDTIVLLTGNIADSLGDSKYTFRDRTGEITVEIDRKAWGNLQVSETDTVEISGEVDVERGRIIVDVNTIRKE